MKPITPFNRAFRTKAFQAACAVVLCGVYAAPAQAFDLLEAWQAALNYSADYAAAQHERDAEQERKVQARAALLPQVTANAVYQKQPPSLSSTTESHGWNIQASQSIYDQARWAQYRQGSLAAEMADQKLNQVKGDLLLQVAQAYFQVLLNRDKMASAEQEKQTYEQQTRQAQAMFEKGLATMVDTNEAQANYAAVRAKQVTILTDLMLAENTLANLTGLNPKEIQPISRNLSDHLLGKDTLNDWQNTARANNPEWQRQRLMLESAKVGVTAAKAGYLPKLTLTGGYQDNRNTQNYYGTEQRYRSKGGSITLQLSIPLYSGGQIRSQVREAVAREQQNQATLLATERKIQAAVNQYYQITYNSRYQIIAQEKLLKANSVKLNATKLGHTVGVRTNLDELQAMQAQADAEQKLAEARYQYLTAYLQLLNSAGVLTNEKQQEQVRTWWNK